jgi:hypothetical protein
MKLYTILSAGLFVIYPVFPSVKKYIVFSGIFITLGISCQNKNKMNEKFEWRETISCPAGYPVDVYRGGLESADGGFTSLYLGTHSGIEGWGCEGRSMSHGVKTVPDRLHVIWLSYAEDMFYEIDTALDYEKMTELFQKGYYTPINDPDRPEPFKREYDLITAGFAPGGIAVVWLSGISRQVEIGRYKGHGVRIPKEESDRLEKGPVKNMFDPEYRRRTMKNIGIVPLEVQKANEGKPIPFGLWDSYRKKYRWKLHLILPDNQNPGQALPKKVVSFYYNGELDILFGQSDIERYPNIIRPESRWDNELEKAVPRELRISWISNGVLIVAEIQFNEEEVFKVFQEVYKDNPELETELVIRASMGQDDLSVKLIPKGEDVNVHKGWLIKSKIKFFDTSKY